MRGERRLGPRGVNAAERARTTGNVALAVELTTDILGLPLTQAELTAFTQDRQQLAILACLARIQVDALKTSANQTRSSRRTAAFLEQATGTIKNIHTNPIFRAAIDGVTEDHERRTHHFAAETKRDVAKTLFAASSLYRGEKGNELILLGQNILQDTYDSLPDTHPTKPLIGIELRFSQLSTGKELTGEDKETLLADFAKLIATDGQDNPHRVATVASWFVIWGQELKDGDFLNRGIDVYHDAIKGHPEWRLLGGEERQKISVQKWRDRWKRLTAPLVSSRRRRALHTDLMGTQSLISRP